MGGRGAAMTPAQRRAYAEYDSVADWCAVHHLRGDVGDRLPDGLSVKVSRLIDDDPEAFQARVRACAYERAQKGWQR